MTTPEALCPPAAVPLLTRAQLRVLQSLGVCPANLSEVLYADARALVEGGLAALEPCPTAGPGDGPRRWRVEITPAGRGFLTAGP